jgi:maltose O-acetyltransferase
LCKPGQDLGDSNRPSRAGCRHSNSGDHARPRDRPAFDTYRFTIGRVFSGTHVNPEVHVLVDKCALARANEHFHAPVRRLLGRSYKMPARTEKDKMLAGEDYNGLDPELEAERQKTKRLLRLYNSTDDALERQAILQQLLGRMGQNCAIEPPFFCSYGHNIYMGDRVYLNFMCTIFDNAEVRIAIHVMIGPGVQIYTAAHPIQARTRIQGWEVAKPIVIEDNVWIGGGAILLPGVTVGRNAVAGAGAVVSRSVPANTVVVGNPARVVREIEQ